MTVHNNLLRIRVGSLIAAVAAGITLMTGCSSSNNSNTASADSCEAAGNGSEIYEGSVDPIGKDICTGSKNGLLASQRVGNNPAWCPEFTDIAEPNSYKVHPTITSELPTISTDDLMPLAKKFDELCGNGNPQPYGNHAATEVEALCYDGGDYIADQVVYDDKHGIKPSLVSHLIYRVAYMNEYAGMSTPLFGAVRCSETGNVYQADLSDFQHYDW